jgi:murein DD-endopeptidase MepM/ murein hydrolase activator NlpD
VLINQHFPIQAQRDALDVVVLKNGKYAEGDAAELASHACFGETIYAPAAGRVVSVLGDRPDVAIGKTDLEQIVGNHVVLELEPGRYVLFAHLKQNSVVVNAGDEVACGQPLAQCGNSGNTSQPHLHIQVQSHPDFGNPALTTFPLVFRSARGTVFLRRNDRLTGAGCSAGASR